MIEDVRGTTIRSRTFINSGPARVLVVVPDWTTEKHNDALYREEAQAVARFLSSNFCDQTLRVIRECLEPYK